DEGAECAAHLPHDGGGGDAVPHDVADGEGSLVGGQGGHVVPVAAHLTGVGGGHVAVGDLDTTRGFEAAGQHASLQGQGGVVLAGVAEGVVDRGGGLGRDFLGIGPLVLLERAGVLR